MAQTLGAVTESSRISRRKLPAWMLASFSACLLVLPAFSQTIQLDSRDLLKKAAGLNAQPAAPAPQPAAAPTPASPAEAPPSGVPPAVNPAPVAPLGRVAQGYLYVDAFQTRFEFLIDAPRLLHWLNPSEQAPALLDDTAQQTAVKSVRKQVEGWCRLGVGGLKLDGTLTGISVIKGRPGATLPTQPGEKLKADEAMFGFMWEFATPPVPEEIIVEWRGFIGDIQKLPIRAFFGPRSEDMEMNAYLPKVSWKSQGRLPMPAPLAAIPEIRVEPPTVLPLATVIWMIIGTSFFIFVKIRGRGLPGGALPFILTWLLGAVLTWPMVNIQIAGGPQVPVIREKKQAEEILPPLLRNVYRAFDRRSESDIYDVLARSVDGELLRKLYLETIEALTLDGREGARVSISEFSADVMNVTPGEGGGGFVTECQWTALGNVGHWGHTHTRVNRYKARVTVSAVENAWKITALDVTETRRI
jgi:hypothetical protein